MEACRASGRFKDSEPRWGSRGWKRWGRPAYQGRFAEGSPTLRYDAVSLWDTDELRPEDEVDETRRVVDVFRGKTSGKK